MSKIRRRSTSCFNCETPLHNKENFCPVCGQENHNKQASIGVIANDLVQDYTGYDSTLVRSLRSLLFSPGQMTEDYLDGKQKQFVPPIRLFLFLSFSYFGTQWLLSGGSIAADLQILGDEKLNDVDEKLIEVVGAIRNNQSLFALLFSPIQAMLVMLLFRSAKRRYYVDFFVFTLHLFSFFFMLWFLFDVIDWALPEKSEETKVWHWLRLGIGFVEFVYIAIYSYVSFRRVFQKRMSALRLFALAVISLVVSLVFSITLILFLSWVYGLFDALRFFLPK